MPHCRTLGRPASVYTIEAGYGAFHAPVRLRTTALTHNRISMPLVKRSNLERWAAQVAAVQKRQQRIRQRRQAENRARRERQRRAAHRQSRMGALQQLKRLDRITRRIFRGNQAA